MKKLNCLIFLLFFSFLCFAEEDYIYSKGFIKSEYDSNISDSIEAKMITDGEYKNQYIVSTYTYNRKKSVNIGYSIICKTKDVMSNILFELLDFERTLYYPSFKEYVEKLLKKDNAFKLIDTEIEIDANTNQIIKTTTYLYTLDFYD